MAVSWRTGPRVNIGLPAETIGPHHGAHRNVPGRKPFNARPPQGGDLRSGGGGVRRDTYEHYVAAAAALLWDTSLAEGSEIGSHFNRDLQETVAQLWERMRNVPGLDHRLLLAYLLHLNTGLETEMDGDIARTPQMIETIRRSTAQSTRAYWVRLVGEAESLSAPGDQTARVEQFHRSLYWAAHEPNGTRLERPQLIEMNAEHQEIPAMSPIATEQVILAPLDVRVRSHPPTQIHISGGPKNETYLIPVDELDKVLHIPLGDTGVVIHRVPLPYDKPGAPHYRLLLERQADATATVILKRDGRQLALGRPHTDVLMATTWNAELAVGDRMVITIGRHHFTYSFSRDTQTDRQRWAPPVRTHAPKTSARAAPSEPPRRRSEPPASATARDTRPAAQYFFDGTRWIAISESPYLGDNKGRLKLDGADSVLHALSEGIRIRRPNGALTPVSWGDFERVHDADTILVPGGPDGRDMQFLLAAEPPRPRS
jgi:hypothetical protein